MRPLGFCASPARAQRTDVAHKPLLCAATANIDLKPLTLMYKEQQEASVALSHCCQVATHCHSRK